MSTRYYRLRPPITNLRIETGKRHNTLWVWVNHALVGNLILYEGEIGEILDCFTLFEDDTKCPMRTLWGSDERGCVVYSNDDLPDDMQVISQRRELMTVREVKAKDGKGKEWSEKDIPKSGNLNTT